MGVSEVVKAILLFLFPGWDFVVIDAKVRSGRVAMGWHLASCSLRNYWGSDSCIGTGIYSHELSVEFRFFNVYGPFQNRETF